MTDTPTTPAGELSAYLAETWPAVQADCAATGHELTEEVDDGLWACDCGSRLSQR